MVNDWVRNRDEFRERVGGSGNLWVEALNMDLVHDVLLVSALMALLVCIIVALPALAWALVLAVVLMVAVALGVDP